MDIAQIFGALEDIHSLLVGDFSAVSGLGDIVAEIANANAPLGLNIARAFAAVGLGAAARG